MRTVDWREWKERRKTWRSRSLAIENRFVGRAAGRRPRDPEKERVLTQLDVARWKRYLESGKVEILGPRLWKWRIDVK